MRGFLQQHVSKPTQRDDEIRDMLLRLAFVEFFAQTRHQRIESALRHLRCSPDGLHQLPTGNNFSAVKREFAQQQVFAASEPNLCVVVEETVLLEVEGEAAEGDFAGAVQAGATAGAGETCEQLREGEWLGEVVVGADVEAGDDVILFVERGKHDDGRAVGSLREMRGDGEAAAVGKADVEHDGVEVVRVGEVLALLGGGRGNDGVAVVPEAAAQEIDHTRVVFDDEDAQMA